MKNDYMNLFGLNFQVEEFKTKGLPIYLTSGRSFFKLSYGDSRFLLVSLSENERFGVLAFEKQEILLSEKYGLPVAFEFQNITRQQRDSLISKNIAYISNSGQLYLPFLGIALSNKFKKSKEVKTEKMMPVTQALFLYMLYKSEGKPVMKKDAADYLGVTRTSITRASDQLDAIGLISQKNIGKEYLMTANGSGVQLYEKAKPFLINPIQSIITTSGYKGYENNLLSGESALAKCTMLNDPKIPSRAVYKAHVDQKQFPRIDIRWEPDVEAVNLELWKYDPTLFSDNGIVDPVSLSMCFGENVDERIEGSIEDYLEEKRWLEQLFLV